MVGKDMKIATNLPKEMQSHHYSVLYEVEETHWWYLGRRRIIQSFVERICATLDTTAPRILDVGCGTGANLKMLASYGKAEGVDISQQAREHSFELVTALDVIEHLDDDLAGLKEMRRVLCTNGRVLLFVPAFMFLWGVQDDVSNHRRRYTLPGLLKVVEAAGFTVERASYANIIFFVPVLAVRTGMRWLGLRAATEYGINISLMNRPFSWLFGAERFVLERGRFPFGVSAVCVARRVEEVSE